MPNPDPVRQRFTRELSNWQRLRERWAARCGGGLVADAAPRGRRGFDPGASVADTAGSTTAPSGCDAALARIDRVIAKLRDAAATGRWSSDRLQVSVRRSAAFISPELARLSRGERFQVLSFQGDWWQVRTDGGAVGWLQLGTVVESPPAELSPEQGVPQRPMRRDDMAAQSSARG